MTQMSDCDSQNSSRLSLSDGRRMSSVLEEDDSLIGRHYQERLLRRGRHEQTVNNFCRAWVCFLHHCEQQGLSPTTIEPWQVEEFFESLPYAHSVKRLYLTQVRAAYRYAQRRGMCDRDPTIDVEIPLEREKVIHTLSAERLREIKAKCYNDRQWLMFHLFAYTGARKDEVRRLEWESVSLRNNTIFVLGKQGKSRLVPIHPALGEVLSGYKPALGKALLGGPYGKPFSYNHFHNMLKQIDRDVKFHDFRRTVASSLDANGADEGVINRIMGWAPKSIFDRHYRNVAPERLQKAILLLYADDPI